LPEPDSAPRAIAGWLFANRQLRDYMASPLLMMPSMLIMSMCLSFQVYDVARSTRGVSESAMIVGYFALIMFLPLMLFIIPAGGMADRKNRQTIVSLCLLAELALAVLLAFVSIYGASLMLLAIIAFGFGFARASHLPASQAILPDICTPEVLPRALAFGATMMQLSSIAAPFAAGLLYAASPSLAYTIAAIFAGLALILNMRLGLPAPTPSHEKQTMTNLFAGAAFLMKERVLQAVMALELVAALFGGVAALSPAIARDLLGGNTDDAGMIRAAAALGGSLAAIYMTSNPKWSNSMRLMVLALILFGAANAAVGMAKTMLMVCIMVAIAGFGQMISGVIRQNLIMIKTPSQLRGRVSSVSTLFAAAGFEIGSFEAGVATRMLGLSTALVVNGTLGTLGAMLFGLRLSKSEPQTTVQPQNSLPKREALPCA
jgi:MFS family permease